VERRSAWCRASCRRCALAWLAVGVALLVAGACAGRGAGGGKRGPCGLPLEAREAVGDAPPAAQPDSARDPAATKLPVLINRGDIARMVRTLSAPYSQASMRPEAAICAYVSEDGIPRRVLLAKSTEVEALDSIAVQAGWAMRFEPALADGEPVAVWVRVPIAFPGRR